MTPFIVVVGVAFGVTVASIIFARPMARWLRQHSR